MTARKKKGSREKNTTSAVDIESKISDARLKSFAEGDSSRRRTVLIRLDVPKPRLSIGEGRRIGNTRLPRKRLRLSNSQLKERQEKISEFVSELEELEIENNPLASGTVIAKLYPDQLRDIVQSELVEAIIPNRKYRFR